MKKNIIAALMGCTVLLAACGSQQAVTAPAGDAQTTANTQTTEEPQGADEAQTEESSETSGAQNSEETEAAAETEAAEQESYDENIDYISDDVITAEYVKVTVPDEFKGKVLAAVNGEYISFYDKDTVDEGYPGHVFTIVTNKDNSVMAGGMFEKVGEVRTSAGDIINVCVGYASDVQWDYTKHEEMPENYGKILDGVDAFVRNVEAVDGTFGYGAGTKGEDIYPEVLAKYVTAFKEGWDANKFEEEEMSPEFYSVAQAGDPLENVGYAYVDITHDGVDELLLGEITGTDEPSVLYDVYTALDGKPVHVVSGSARDRYYTLEYGGLVNEYSGGANESGMVAYEIEPGTSNLFYQYGVKYDGYTDEKNPWFVSYSENEWEPMTEEEYNERMDMVTSQYSKVPFKPLSGVAAQ
jgi:hypothetical protein